MEQGVQINAELFGKLFVENKERFKTIARSYVRDDAFAEDIVLDCFASFWDKRHEIQIKTSPEQYILKSIKNRCLNHLRDLDNHKNVHMPSILMTDLQILESNLTDKIFEVEAERIFNRFIKDLPSLTRDIFLSSRMEDLTYEQIALKYGISQRKVKREVQSVLQGIRIALADYLPVLSALAASRFFLH